MTPDKVELLNRCRREIAELQRHVADFHESGTHILNSRGVNITDIFVAKLNRQISDLETLVEKHDPDGFTTLL